MKKILLLLSIFAVLLTSCKNDYVEPDKSGVYLEATTSVRNGEVFPSDNVFPGDTVTLSLEISGSTNYEAKIETLKIWLDIDEHNDLSSIDTVEMDDVINTFSKVIPLNRSFKNDFDSLLELQFVIPDYKINILSQSRIVGSIKCELAYSNSTGDSLEPELYSYNFNFLNNVGHTEYTFKLYNNYVGKPFDDPTGVGFNLYTQEYLNTPCVLDDLCFQGTDYKESRFLELPTIYNMSYLPEANPEEKFFVPAFGNLDGFGSTDALVKRNNYNFERRFNYDNPDLENLGYHKIAPSVEVGDIFSISHWFIRLDGNRIPRIYLRVLDIVEAAEDSYVEFEVFISRGSMNVFNEYHGL